MPDNVENLEGPVCAPVIGFEYNELGLTLYRLCIVASGISGFRILTAKLVEHREQENVNPS